MQRLLFLISCTTLAFCLIGARAQQLDPFNLRNTAVWKPEAARNPNLPPVEFDHEYDGPMTLERGNLAFVTSKCPDVKPAPWVAGFLGCTRFHVDSRLCEVYIVDDKTLVFYRSTFDVTYRHERGHCNGWRHPKPEITRR